MKNKITAIIVALGSAIFAAPAHAIQGTPATVGVNVTVPEILYLRTVSTINATLTPADLGASGTFTGGYGTDSSGTADDTPLSTLDTTSPFTTAGSVSKTIPGVYVVWSNSSAANAVAVDVAPDTDPVSGGVTLPLTIDDALNDITGATPNGLLTPVSGGTPAATLGSVVLGLDASSALAGAYTGGSITITVSTP